MFSLADFFVEQIPISLPKHLTTWIPGETPFSTTDAAFGATLTYLVAIFGIQAVLVDQLPLKLNRAFQAHNLILCIGSAVLLALFLEEMIPIIWNNGIFHALCDEEAYTSRIELYHIINYYFKYYELLDTVFLALKKKPLRFLHVYHHAATALLSYAGLNSRGSLSWTISSINLGIHVVMYYYYFRTAMGARIWWKKYLTTMQISQFVVDIGVLAFAAYTRFAFNYARFLPNKGDCSGSTDGGVLCLVLVSSYLLLFLDFYRQTFNQKRALSRNKGKTGSNLEKEATDMPLPSNNSQGH